MRFSSTYIASLLLTAVFITLSAGAKEGLKATILTSISPGSPYNSEVYVITRVAIYSNLSLA